MRPYHCLLFALVLPAGLHAQTRTVAMTQHATGTFEVTMTPEAQGAAPGGGVPTSRMGLAKTFHGGLEGTAVGTMLAAGMPKPGTAAAYVAIDQFSGTLEGRRGGFVLVHRGTMTKAGEATLDVMVAPDSGTGQLEGLAGELRIKVEGGVHAYDFAYALPGAK